MLFLYSFSLLITYLIAYNNNPNVSQTKISSLVIFFNHELNGEINFMQDVRPLLATLIPFIFLWGMGLLVHIYIFVN